MYKPGILIIFLYFLTITLSAQHILFDWQNCLKGGKYNTERSVLCKADSGYFIAATQERGSHVDIVLLKTVLTGDSLWSKYYGGSDDDWSCGVFPTPDGNYYLVGTECSEDGDLINNPYPNSCNIWIIKIDISGNKLWDKIYGGSNFDEAMNVVVTNDGGMAILGSTFSYDGDISNFYGAMDVWLLKLDNNGNKQWDFTVGTPGFDYAYGITQTQDSGFIVGGGFKEGTNGNIQCYNADSNYLDGFLFQLDKNGIFIRKKCFHGSKDDRIEQVLTLAEGYLVSGSTSSPDIALTEIGYHPGSFNNGTPTIDFWLQKTDFDFNVEWQRCYGGSGWDYIIKVYPCSNGDYMMFGTTNSYNGDVNGIHHNGLTDQSQDIWMVRLNSLGDILWQRCIGTYERQEIATNSVLKITEADYVIACTTPAGGNEDIECTSSSSSYDFTSFVWLFQITDTAASVGVTDQPQPIEAKLYPNPAHEFATVEIPVTYALQNAYAEVIDASGRVICRFKVTEKKFVLNTSGYSKGIYLLRISDARGVITKRFIVG